MWTLFEIMNLARFNKQTHVKHTHFRHKSFRNKGSREKTCLKIPIAGQSKTNLFKNGSNQMQKLVNQI